MLIIRPMVSAKHMDLKEFGTIVLNGYTWLPSEVDTQTTSINVYIYVCWTQIVGRSQIMGRFLDRGPISRSWADLITEFPDRGPIPRSWADLIS